jgi:siroheme synthase (precorrin-2 oxidase/ferrochelatase)
MNNMPIIVAPPRLNVSTTTATNTPAAATEVADLLRQLIDVQKEQLQLARTAADVQTRWRNFLARWNEEFPGIGLACKEVLPTIERVYLRMLQDLTDRLRGEEPDDLENEFVLAEFLDKYGLRLSQLGTIVSQLSPIADATPPPPPSEPANDEKS